VAVAVAVVEASLPGLSTPNGFPCHAVIFSDVAAARKPELGTPHRI
jgi:hypothetical protein